MRDLFLPIAILVTLIPTLAILAQQFHLLRDLRGKPDFWPATVATVVMAGIVGCVTTWAVVMVGYAEQWDLAARHLGLQ